jgi:hypothetical protein
MNITLTREEAQQVHDALEEIRYADISASQEKAIETLRAQLSQCERCGEVNPAEIHTCTPKSEWKWLTDEEIEQIIDKHWDDPSMFAEAIEAKLKQKNA